MGKKKQRDLFPQISNKAALFQDPIDSDIKEALFNMYMLDKDADPKSSDFATAQREMRMLGALMQVSRNLQGVQMKLHELGARFCAHQQAVCGVEHFFKENMPQ